MLQCFDNCKASKCLATFQNTETIWFVKRYIKERFDTYTYIYFLCLYISIVDIMLELYGTKRNTSIINESLEV